jgi:hypothetical protein
MVFVTEQKIIYVAREYKIPVVRIELEGNHNNATLNDIELEQLFASLLTEESSIDITRSINIINEYLHMLDVFINHINDEIIE